MSDFQFTPSALLAIITMREFRAYRQSSVGEVWQSQNDSRKKHLVWLILKIVSPERQAYPGDPSAARICQIL
jgi:hypothetical protein